MQAGTGSSVTSSDSSNSSQRRINGVAIPRVVLQLIDAELEGTLQLTDKEADVNAKVLADNEFANAVSAECLSAC